MRAQELLALVDEHLRQVGSSRCNMGVGATSFAKAGLKLLAELLRCGEYGNCRLITASSDCAWWQDTLRV